MTTFLSQAECKIRGLKAAGSKAALLERLLSKAGGQAQHTEAPDAAAVAGAGGGDGAPGAGETGVSVPGRDARARIGAWGGAEDMGGLDVDPAGPAETPQGLEFSVGVISEGAARSRTADQGTMDNIFASLPAIDPINALAPMGDLNVNSGTSARTTLSDDFSSLFSDLGDVESSISPSSLVDSLHSLQTGSLDGASGLGHVDGTGQSGTGAVGVGEAGETETDAGLMQRLYAIFEDDDPVRIVSFPLVAHFLYLAPVRPPSSLAESCVMLQSSKFCTSLRSHVQLLHGQCTPQVTAAASAGSVAGAAASGRPGTQEEIEAARLDIDAQVDRGFFFAAMRAYKKWKRLAGAIENRREPEVGHSCQPLFDGLMLCCVKPHLLYLCGCCSVTFMSFRAGLR